MSSKDGAIPATPPGPENVPGESDYPQPNSAGQKIVAGQSDPDDGRAGLTQTRSVRMPFL